MASGSGIGFPIAGALGPISPGYGACCPVPLPLYSRIIRYNECAFWGVAHSDNDQYTNRVVWTLRERQEVSWWLQEAQTEIEDVMGFPACARWVEDERAYRRNPIWAKYRRVIGGGVSAEQVLEDGATVNNASDPAEVVINGVSASLDTDEVHVRYPDDDTYEICPSEITLSGTVLTILIPRCRLATIEAQETVTEDHRIGVDYSDVNNFLAEVDVVRVYNDASTQVTFIGPDCADGCEQQTQAGCIRVRRPRLGSLVVRAGTYSAGTWTTCNLTFCPETVQLYYMAGFVTPTRQVIDSIIRLAHVKMPAQICLNLSSQYMWLRDRNVPEVLSRERYNCPFGMADGAWIAYKYALAMKVTRGRQASTGRKI